MGIKHVDVKASGDKGLASEWNKDHVIDGDVDFGGHAILNDATIAIRKGTHYWSTPAGAFQPNSNGYDYYHDPGDNKLHITAVSGDEFVLCPVNLPNGALITACKVFGSDISNVWYLYRRKLDRTTAETEMASANVNTEDTTITEATIDNINYCYWIEVYIGNGDDIYGARVTYTL